MKWSNKNLPRSRTQLEQFVRDNGLHAYGVVHYKGRDIFLAETELENDKPLEYPWGYYQAAWFVSSPSSMEKFDVGSWAEYEAMHDKEQGWTLEAKRKARLNDVLTRATKWIDESEEAGRYAN